MMAPWTRWWEAFVQLLFTIKFTITTVQDYKFRLYSRNLGWHLILTRKDTFLWKKGFFFFFFWKKDPKTLTPLPSPIQFLFCVLHNNNLHKFCERGQHSVVECNIALEVAMKLLWSIWKWPYCREVQTDSMFSQKNRNRRSINLNIVICVHGKCV